MTLFRLFVATGLLVVIVLFGLLLVPYFVDWTVYRKEFETQASRVFGQPVKVGGEASLRVLPLPSVSFSDLSIGTNPDGTPMMTIGRFTLNAELMPFLSGEVKVVDLVLDDPVINLQVSEDGKVAWTARTEMVVDPEQVTLEKVTVRNGSILVAGLTQDLTLKAENIRADISARSLYGPWRIDATGLVEGADTGIQVTTGTLQDRGTIRVKATMQRFDQPYRLMLDGPVGLENDVLAWNGKFEFDPARDQTTQGERFSTAEALPVHADGDFSLNPSRLEVPQYRVEIGPREDPFSLTGTGGAKLKDGVFFNVQVDGRQIDLDRVARASGTAEGQGAASMEQRIAAIRKVLDRIPVPRVAGEVDIEIPAIVAGDTLIREVSALVRPYDDGWEIARLHSLLPGNTQLEAAGRVGRGEEFGFNGHVTVASRQPSGFAAWAAGRVDPAIRRLAQMGLEADLTLTQNTTALDNLELVLDANRLTGRIERIAGTEARPVPALVVQLEGPEIRLDDLQALYGMTGGETPVATHDLDVSVKADLLEVPRLRVGGVDLQFQRKGGEITISRLNASDLLGASISSTGQIVDLLGKPNGNISVRLSAENAAELVALLREQGGDNRLLRALAKDPALTADADLSLEIEARPSGDDARGRVILEGKMGNTDLSVRTAFEGSFANPENVRIDLSSDFTNESPEILLAQAGLIEPDAAVLGTQIEGLQDLGMGEGITGPLTVTLESVGNAAEGMSTIMSANAPGISFSTKGLVHPLLEGSGMLSLLAPELESHDFDLTFGADDVSPLMAAFGYRIPGLDPLAGGVKPVSLTARSHFEAGKTDVSSINLQVNGVATTGDLAFATSEAGRPSVTGKLATQELPLTDMAALALGLSTAGLETTGWPENEFAEPLLSGKDARIVFRADRVDTGLDNAPATGAVFDLVLSDGAMTLDKIVADWLGGTIEGSLSLSNLEGNGIMRSAFKSNGVDAASLARVTGMPDMISGKLSFSGSADGTGRSPQAMANSLSGSGIANVSGGALRGIGTGGLASVLAAADGGMDEFNAATVDPLAREAFLTGEIPLEDASVPFSINRGIVRIDNLVRAGEGYTARLNGQVSLGNGAIEADAALRIDPGKEKVTGAEPEVRFSWSGTVSEPVTSVDSQALQGYLSIRAFEQEQRRVEMLQASILEKQMLRFYVLKSNAKAFWREEQRKAELRRLEEEQRRLEAERLAREEAERKAAEEEAARKAAEEAARIAEEEARRAAEEEARKAAEAEAARKAAEEAAARKAAEEEAARKAAEEAAARKAAEEAAARKAAEEAAARKAAEEAARNAPQEQLPGVERRNLPPPSGSNGGAATTKPEEAEPQVNPNIFKRLEELLLRQQL